MTAFRMKLPSVGSPFGIPSQCDQNLQGPSPALFNRHRRVNNVRKGGNCCRVYTKWVRLIESEAEWP
jgi:hypothetical protein